MNELIYELYREWCRLKGYKLSDVPIEVMIDQATGAEKARMEEFSEWFTKEILTRVSV